MATIRLIPSTYAVSSTTYLSVSNAANMYHNTDNTTYATITNTNASTSSRYLYIRGFNFNDIPSEAEITDFTVKIKGYESGLSTSTSYAPRLANGTSALSNTTASSSFSTSVKTITIPTGALTWQQIVNYGSNFTIMVYVRRNNKNTTGYFYCYGAEIEVTYTIPDPRTITTTLNGNGTINPSGSTIAYDGDEFELTITPAIKSDTVTAIQDGVDITSELIGHGGSSETISKTATSYTTGGSISSGSSYLSYPVGYTAENPHTYSSNVYASSGSTGYAIYSFDFSDIPSNAVIDEVEVKCSGHRESSTDDSSHITNLDLYTNTTLKVESKFTSTSTQTITIDGGTWTRAELQEAKLRFTVGYYGGQLYGITWKVIYSIPNIDGPDYYTYTYVVNGNSNIIITIGNSTQPQIHIKKNGVWTQYSKVFLKINDTWVEQDSSTWSTLFNINANYRIIN